MAGRNDTYHAYRFLSRRNAAALVQADEDGTGMADEPLRRLSGGTAASIVVAVLVAVVALVLGLLQPGSGSSSWRNGKSLIIETGTGTRYVYLSGVLHPVQNYASALLILRSGAVSPVTVSQSALNQVKHGPAVGIPAAPDVIPAAGSLLTGPWTVCSAPATTPAGAQSAVVTVSVGTPARGRPLPGGSAVLVTAAQDDYLIWNGTRLHLPGYAAAALGYAAATPVPAGPAWLNAIPSGPDVAAPEPPNRGQPGPALPGGIRLVIGHVYVSGATYYAAYADGLAVITPLQEKLMMADTGYNGGQAPPSPVSLSTDQVQAAGTAKSTPAQTAGFPGTAPSLASVGGAVIGQGVPAGVCATLTSASTGTVRISAFTAGSVQSAAGSSGPPAGPLGSPVANTVAVPPGKGALVRAVPNPGVSTGTLYLVTELGIKYPVASAAVLSDLGLSSAKPSSLPENIVALLPTGPTLDESSALKEAGS